MRYVLKQKTWSLGNNFKILDLSKAGRDNLVAFLDSGKGLVALHFAVAALQNCGSTTLPVASNP